MRTAEDRGAARKTGSDHVVSLGGEGFPRLPRRPRDDPPKQRPSEPDDAETYAVLGED